MLLVKRNTQRLLLRVAGSIWLGSLLTSFSAQAASPKAPGSAVSSAASKSHASVSAGLPAGVSPHYLSELTALYSRQHMQPMWSDSHVVKAFQQQLAEVALSGIQPQFTTWVTWLTDPKLNGFARDVVLSDAMLGYMQFVAGVEKNGNSWLYSSVPYKLAAPSTEMMEQWQRAVASGNGPAFIASLAPRHSQYAKMHDALKNMLTDNRPWPKLILADSLRPGDESNALPVLKEILLRTGMLNQDGGAMPLFNEASSGNASPMRYEGDVVEAVKRFQHSQGLQDDGVIGKRTRDWLNVSSQMRATLLALNIQRLRLVPDKVSSGIVVNIPNYSLSYYQNGAEILSSKVIVGQPKRKTPLMNSSLSNVVMNPPWNVPTTLTRQDIIPKVIQDPGYLQRHGYTVLSDWTESAQPIDPSMIDWPMVSAGNFPYRLRQAPGDSNSLGRYKFNMPNTDSIYLHDTPNHNLFQKDIRALSSGCVRVNKASELAALLLQDAGWNNARISSTLEQGNTTYVAVRQRVPVNFYYLTAWVADDGKPQFRTDIYNYDDTVKTGALALSRAGLLLQ
ncbi:L,D-transpeptidase [Dickeya dianthicola]|uniref:L,D-transpeptidase n=1 Tax=Dickeya dianthicola TaxID=204039 RepID=UPI00136E16D7|nr:L,D-transpeptidase [Dickeya dianthicola]MCI4236971.1 L,D-transpeptidase [Dickeya dianthicola]MCI4254069.1 L,D-transpeptidase [Dickeya dianthicola]MZG23142.1 L,D-transpeptidase [Dickeya dianthicola]MZI90798.1 L,D-transpeptidase [Dickeya dianthicola]